MENKKVEQECEESAEVVGETVPLVVLSVLNKVNPRRKHKLVQNSVLFYWF